MKIKITEGYTKYQIVKGLDRRAWGDLLPPAYWDYRRRWEENPRRFIVEDFPLHLGVEITTHCNLACAFCCRTTSLRRRTFRPVRHMPLELLQAIVDQARGKNLAGLCLNGIGEPLLHPDLVAMIRYAKEQGQVLDLMFHTNGMLLTPRLSAEIIEAGLDQIIFSIDGSAKADYEAQRPGAEYDRVVANVRRFHEIRAAKGRRLPCLRVTMIITPQTTEESAARFLDAWAPLADVLTFQELGLYEPSGADQAAWRRNPEFICTQPWQRLAIDVKGQILPCCEAFALTDEMVLGQVGADRIQRWSLSCQAAQ